MDDLAKSPKFNPFIGKNPHLGITTIYFDVLFTGMCLNNIGGNIIVGLCIIYFKHYDATQKYMRKQWREGSFLSFPGALCSQIFYYLRYIAIIRDNHITVSISIHVSPKKRVQH
jgi:hypothetical protein